MSRIITLFAALAIFAGVAAHADIELPPPTYTGQLAGAGPDFLVLDTDFRGRRLLVVDPDTVFVEPVYPSARLRVVFRMGEDNHPHARLVEPAPEPSVLPVPLDRARGEASAHPLPQLVDTRPPSGWRALGFLGAPWGLVAWMLLT
jgi:hypothetical protein